jgi:coatomer protein complex subunit epsilon
LLHHTDINTTRNQNSVIIILLLLSSWIHSQRKGVRKRTFLLTDTNSIVRILTTSSATELVNIHNAFHQGQYQNVIDFDTSSFSAENALPARVLQLRAKIALGQTEEVVADVAGEEDTTPELAAVKALAQHTAGDSESALTVAEDLAEKASDNATVQVLCGTVLHAQGKTEEALALLAKHQGNLEA